MFKKSDTGLLQQLMEHFSGQGGNDAIMEGLPNFQSHGEGGHMTPEQIEAARAKLRAMQEFGQQLTSHAGGELQDVATHDITGLTQQLEEAQEGMGAGTGALLGAGAGAGTLGGGMALKKHIQGTNAQPSWMKPASVQGDNMSLLDQIKNAATTTNQPKVASMGASTIDLDAIMAKLAEDDDEEGGAENGGSDNQGDDENGGNDENGNIPGLGEGQEEANEGVQLPPELQHLLMMLMQHPEILQQIMQGGGMPDEAPGGMPPGMEGGPEGQPGMPPEMAAAGGGAPGM